jgi:uncharacterized protein (UPF0335 family)
MIEKDLIIKFYQNIEGMEDHKKAIAEDINESLKAFSSNNGINIKALKKGYKNYKEYVKNREEFIETDTEADALTQAFVQEYQEVAD